MQFRIEYAGFLSATGTHTVGTQSSERQASDVLSFAGQFRSHTIVIARDLDSAIKIAQQRFAESEFKIDGFEGDASFEHLWIVRVLQKTGDDWVEVWESDQEGESWIRIG